MATLPFDRALGVHWCVENDSMRFKINLQSQSTTKRGFDLRSTWFAAPFLVAGRKILQKLFQSNLGWDDPIPFDACLEWTQWQWKLHFLEKIKIARCFTPAGFGHVKEISLHHFADASEIAYGQVSYVRLVNEGDKIHCALVTGKARVTPSKQSITIPRLELVAAAFVAKVGKVIRREIECEVDYESCWSNSQVVLGYIKNSSKRFRLFVANHVARIRKLTKPDNWRYVTTKSSPADYASRGLQPTDVSKSAEWLKAVQEKTSKFPTMILRWRLWRVSTCLQSTKMISSSDWKACTPIGRNICEFGATSYYSWRNWNLAVWKDTKWSWDQTRCLFLTCWLSKKFKKLKCL